MTIRPFAGLRSVLGSVLFLATGICACESTSTTSKPPAASTTCPSSPPSAVATASASPQASNSAYVLQNTQIRTLPRSSNGRDYLLYVGLPNGYDTDTNKRYPVMYICDGYWDFALIRAFYGNLIFDKDIPEFIVVGFGYQGDKPDYDKLRKYDYTPVVEPGHPESESGHAGPFLKVVEKEFLPFIEKNYRADPSFRVLGGSSLGGLFTLYSMFERPGLFQGYIAPSPAVDWANDYLFAREADFKKAKKTLNARLFLSGASEEWPPFIASIKRFNAVITPDADALRLQYKWHLVPGERHAGTKAESYTRGVRWVFATLAFAPNPN